jgi:serine protease SohB
MAQTILQKMADYVPRRWRRDAALVTVVRLSGVIGFSTPLSPGMSLSTVSKTLERAFSVK